MSQPVPEKRTAPVQSREVNGARIPWEIHERAAKQYNANGDRQSAERLAERGGFGIWELAILLAGGDPFAAGSRPGWTESSKVWGLPE